MTTELLPVRTDRFDARKVGFLADTHVKSADDLSPAVARAFADVDLIVHVGHIGNIELLDWLQRIAPTVAVVVGLDRTQNAEAISGPYAARVADDHRIIETPWASIGVQFNLSAKNNAAGEDPPPFPSERGATAEWIRAQFGRSLDVVVQANTHMASVHVRDGVLFVDPGSPNLPGGWRSGGLGTVATIEVVDGFIRPQIIDLERVGDTA